jgi:hypothetical protein
MKSPATTFRFGSYFLTWLLGCFALGAIATVVSGFDHEDSDGVWRPDSHQRTRDHFGGVVLVALITFCALLIGMGRLEMVETAAIRVVGWSQFSQYNYAAAVLGTVVVASVVSWLGMAVPLTLRGNTGVWGALRRSIELSNGYEGVPVRVGRADSGRFLFRLVSDSLCPETLVA